MSKETRLLIPALFGGISHQPAHQRHIHQVQDARNTVFSILDGASKRPGSIFLGAVADLDEEGDFRLHTITRDHVEQYLVIYGAGGVLRVFEVLDDQTLVEATVNIDADAQAYLEANDPTADQLRLVTIADYTIILNRTVSPGMFSEAFDYDVDRTHKNEDVLKSYAPVPGEHHRAMEVAVGDGFFRYLPETEAEARFARWNRRQQNISVEYRTASGHWLNGLYNPMGFRIWFRRPPVGGSDAGATFVADDASHSNKPTVELTGFFADYTHEANDWLLVQVWQDGATFADWSGWGDHPNIQGALFEIDSKVSDDKVVLKDQDGLRFRTTPLSQGHNDEADMPVSMPTTDTTIPNLTGVWKVYNCVVDFTQVTAPADMFDVALELQKALRADGADDACIHWRPDLTYQLDSRALEGETGESPIRDAFEIVSPYRGAEAQIWGPFFPTPQNVGTHNLCRRVYGDDSAPFSNANDGDESEYRGMHTDGTGSPAAYTLPVAERWVTVPPPGDDQTQVEPTTMPIRMRRTSWTGDGTTPAVFEVGTIPWADRLQGTASTNPLPTLLNEGRPIQDISFHRNRLVLAGGESLAFSQVGDFFNFFLDDPENVVDSDPIDIALSSEEVTLVDFVVPFRDRLLVFTMAGRQFEMNSPDALTPTTVALTPSTNYKSQPVRPVLMGNMIYFLGQRRDAGVLYEYFWDEAHVANTAVNVTAHASSLLPPTLRSIAGSPNNDMIAIVPPDCDSVYIYRAWWRGAEKVQSAWTRWTFDSSYQILDIGIIRNDLYMLVRTGGVHAIEQVPLVRQVLQ